MDSGKLTVENVFLEVKKEKTSSGIARVARGGSTRPDERKIQCDDVLM
jgi:hypothetical protein